MTPRLTAILLCLLLTACRSEIIPDLGATPIAPSLWGEVTLIAEGEQSIAPTIAVSNGHVFTAWTGADEIEARQYMSRLPDSDPTILVLSVAAPYSQHMYPAGDGGLHLLWLDQDQVSGDTHLYSATVQPNLIAELGRNALSEDHVGGYTAISTGNGGLQVVWSGGLLDEPTLYTQAIDAGGRIGYPTQIVANAQYPVIMHTAEGLRYVIWLRGSGIYRAELHRDRVVNTQRITDAVPLRSGDRIIDLHTGADQTHGYLFWNINRADGSNESWFSTGEIAASRWTAPERIAVDLPFSESKVQTGFNSGSVDIAKLGSLPATWVSSTGSFGDTVPLATVIDGSLSILYWQSGGVIGYQRIITAEHIIGTPTLITDRDRHLYLAWSELTTSGSSQFFFTSTHQN